ncbi:MAG: BON domain-containing protein [Chromatiales bacterium]|nr:BON domain-containing protein [Chromatiales bacterium]
MRKGVPFAFSSSIALLLLAILLSGCEALVIGGAATGAAMIHDRRSAGTVVDDQNLEIKAYAALKEDTLLDERANVSVTSYNRILLLTGEAPTEELRQQAANLVAHLPGVRRVYNELRRAAPIAISRRGGDTVLTTRVKASLFKVDLPDFDATRVKVVTSDHTVYLMGLLYDKEADAVVETVRRVPGVEKVVKIFEKLG